jgi:Zn-dependent peptidase ImmA (M78 family)/DNA-binding XRE family transcriptional regulator
MPRTKNTVPVKAEVLVWARESLGLTQEKAAASLKVPLETLQAWEGGTEGFGITYLRRIATAYKRPIGALLQPVAPPLPRVPPDFRTVEGKGPAFSVETMVAIRDAQRIQAIATELLASDPGLLPTPPLPEKELTDSAQEFGLLERRQLGISIETQLGWANANFAFNAWRARLQMLGVLVLAKRMQREDCRGFSLYEPGAVPVIVVNTKEVDQAKVFTLLHEYGHLALSGDGICLERDQVSVEHWCNEFSSALLVPQDTLRGLSPGWVTSTDTVRDLAWRFKVSRHVIAIRLKGLGRAPSQLYDDIKHEDEVFDWRELSRTTEQEEEEEKEEGEFVPRPQELVRISEVGYAYAQLILTALDRALISPTDACDFLDIRPEKLRPLAERVRGMIGRYA